MAHWSTPQALWCQVHAKSPACLYNVDLSCSEGRLRSICSTRFWRPFRSWTSAPLRLGILLGGRRLFILRIVSRQRYPSPKLVSLESDTENCIGFQKCCCIAAQTDQMQPRGDRIHVCPLTGECFTDFLFIHSFFRNKKARLIHSHIHLAITGECFTHSPHSREYI